MNIVFGDEQNVQHTLQEVAKTFGSRIQAGAVLAPQNLSDIHGEQFRIPDPRRLIHLQFRRFAGCPVCDLHLHSIVGRRQEISGAGIREVVVFHSSAADLLPYAADLPFAVIADPARQLYSAFGVERGPRALLDQGAWLPVIRGVLRSIGLVLRGKQPIPPLNPEGGSLGLPADFLIATDGRVLACKYGSHAFDQWSVDEILALASVEAGRQRNISDGPIRMR